MEVISKNYLDDAGNPAGGTTIVQENGTKFLVIPFQDGPISERGVNGVQVEHLLEAAQERLEFLNTASYGRYRCEENELAIQGINIAMDALDLRTKRRVKQGDEGYNRGN